MSAITDPHPLEAGAPARAEGSPTAPAEPNRPSSPAALERPIPQQHTSYPSITRKLNPGDSDYPSAGPSSASAASAPPGAIPNIPPSLDFLRPDASSFALPFSAGGFESFAQGLAASSARTGIATPISQPPSALPRSYGFLVPHDPPAPQPISGLQAGTSQGIEVQGQFDMGAGQMFGLEPLGYNESTSFLSSISEPQVGTSGYPQPHDTLVGAAPALGSEDHVDTGMPDFALMDDALTVWSNLPPAVG